MGFGIPLAGVALITGLTTNDAPAPVVEEPVLIAADSTPPAVEEIDAADIIEDYDRYEQLVDEFLAANVPVFGIHSDG